MEQAREQCREARGVRLSEELLHDLRYGLRMLQEVEVMNKMRKGQVKRLDRSDAIGQAKFVESLFRLVA